MKILALKSENSDFIELSKQINSMAPVETCPDSESILDQLPQCAAVFLDLDMDLKKIEKLIKLIKKQDPELPILVLCNSLEPKKLAKHQNSKNAARHYFRYPTDIAVIEVVLSEIFDFDSEGASLSSTEAAIILDHAEKKDISAAASKKSQLLDDALEEAFPEEFRQLESEKTVVSAVQVEEDEPVLEEFVLGDDEFELGDDQDLSAGEQGQQVIDAEISLNEESSEEALSLDTAPSLEEGLSLDDELSFDAEASADDVPSLEAELSLDEDSSFDNDENHFLETEAATGEEFEQDEDLEQEVLLPSRADLEFPDLTSASAPMSLSEDQEDLTEQENLDAGEGLDLEGLDIADGGLDLSISSDDEQAGQVAENDLGLDLSDNSEGFAVESDLLELSGEQVSENEGLDLINELAIDEPKESSGDEVGIDLLGSGEEVDETFDPFADSEEVLSDAPSENIQPELSASDSENASSLDIGEMSLSGFELGGDEIITDIDEDDTDKEDDISLDLTAEPEIEANEILMDESPEIKDSLEGLSEKKTLPDSPPEFTTTIQQKMQEIDAMVDDEATVVADMPELTQSDESTTVHQFDGSEASDSELVEDPATELAQQIEADTSEEVAISSKVSQSTSGDPQRQEYREYVQSRDEELMRLGETIKSLRTDRELLLEKISDFEQKEHQEKKDFLSLQAELDEKKIELEITKKRYAKEIDELKFKLELASDKKDVLAAKNRQIESEFEKIRREKQVDVHRIRGKERELEEKLELLKRDSEVQLRNRDHKILELKRRIDTLEFDIDSAQIRERKKNSDHDLLEDRMDKVIKTLRNVIGQLEDDPTVERHKLLKKNLDV